MVTKRYAHMLNGNRKNPASEMEASFYRDGGKAEKPMSDTMPAPVPAHAEPTSAQAAVPGIDANMPAAAPIKSPSLLVKPLQSVQLADTP